jgi:hypothetical protein
MFSALLDSDVDRAVIDKGRLHPQRERPANAQSEIHLIAN